MIQQPKKKEITDWALCISNIHDYDQIWLDPPYEFTARVQYARGDSSTSRWISFDGWGQSSPRIQVPGDAQGEVEFRLTFRMDTTGCILESQVWDAETDGTSIWPADPRMYVDFIGPGMGRMEALGGPEKWRSEVAPAARTTAGGNTIPPGIYRGKFKQFDDLFVARARVLIQGEPLTAPGPHPKGKAARPAGHRPLKLVYDFPASVCWYKVGNRYQPFWTFCVDRPLTAGEGFRTIMRPVLLRSSGYVEQITTHPY